MTEFLLYMRLKGILLNWTQFGKPLSGYVPLGINMGEGFYSQNNERIGKL